MGTTSDIINNNMPFFDKGDPLYKALIADPDGVPEVTINDPMDYNQGLIGNFTEYNRQLTKSLIKQLYLNQATGSFLTFIVQDMFGTNKYEGETDATMIDRVKDYTLAYKLSRPAILFYLNKYFTYTSVKIYNLQEEDMFGGYSFTGFDSTDLDGGVSLPGYTGVESGGAYSSLQASGGAYQSVIQFTDLPESSFSFLFDFLDRWTASGPEFDIQFIYQTINPPIP